MMKIQFARMHALGNRFLIVDDDEGDNRAARRALWRNPAAVRRLAARQRFDQLLFFARRRARDFDYFILNADGGEAGQCGNGARCVFSLLKRRGQAGGGEIRLSVSGGAKIFVRDAGGEVCARLAQPVFKLDGGEAAAEGKYRWLLDGESRVFNYVNLGNPHAVFFVDDVSDAQVRRWGREMNAGGDGFNVGFCRVVDGQTARLRVYERGVGETDACGSGACAAAVAMALNGIARPGEAITLHLPGGTLRCGWGGKKNDWAWLQGATCFEGEGEARFRV